MAAADKAMVIRPEATHPALPALPHNSNRTARRRSSSHTALRSSHMALRNSHMALRNSNRTALRNSNHTALRNSNRTALRSSRSRMALRNSNRTARLRQASSIRVRPRR